jgi:twitching motility two-component system response regulator PilG
VDRAPLSVRPDVVSRSSSEPPRTRVARGLRGLCMPLQLEGRSLLTVNGSNAKLQGLKVLVIDDSKTIRRTAETLLAKEGCEVFTAIDGFDALAKIADHQPDIVFVDIMMPRLDGYQTCSLIKHNKVFRSIPVIMLSSKDGLFDRARGRIVGSEHYLTKPFTKDELLSAIETHIGR